MDLITLAEYKAYKGTTKTDQDAKISIMISSASANIKKYLRNSLVDYFNTPYVEKKVLDYNASVFFSKEWPVITVTSVVETDRIDGVTQNTLVSGTDYIVSEDRFIRLGGYTWNAFPNPVVLTYTAGYDDTPYDIKIATILLVDYYLSETYIQTRTIMGSSINNFAQNTPDMPAHIARLLDLNIG